uniref:Uncharacterized protein n=1 Tax=Rhizophora mucronata TaxID=61149 RepID=A0A2P2NS25_RHIMU
MLTSYWSKKRVQFCEYFFFPNNIGPTGS